MAAEGPHAPPPPLEDERRHHTYATNRIPWYVHLMWISFWIVTLYYLFRYLVPAVQVELFQQ